MASAKVPLLQIGFIGWTCKSDSLRMSLRLRVVSEMK